MNNLNQTRPFSHKNKKLIRTIVVVSLFVLLGGHTLNDQSTQSDTGENIAIDKKLILVDPELFDSLIDKVVNESIDGLKYYYSTENVRIIVDKNQRTIAQQHQLYESGRSKTRVSLHNIGQAVDILITINGETMHADSPETTIPYQIAGYFARKNGLFWGWDRDSGHIANHETITEFLSHHRELAHHTEIQEFYKILKTESQQGTPVEEKYREFVELYEQLHGIHNTNRTYRDNDDTGESWKLLSAINPFE